MATEDKVVEEVAEDKAPVKKAAKAEAGKEVKRIFRQVNPRVMRNTRIVTLMEEDRIIGNKVVRGRVVRMTPNHASQYVLRPGAISYESQLEVLLAKVEKGQLEEVDPKTEGTPFISKEEQALEEYERKARELRKKLGVPEPTIVI